MPQFRTKLVLVEARQVTKDNWRELEEWGANARVRFIGNRTGPGDDDLDCLGLMMATREGADVFADIGDWIIQRAEGEFNMLSRELFEQTYEPVT